MTKRQYSDDQKAATLALLVANGGNVQKTSLASGVPRATIQKWRDGKVSNMPSATQVAHKKEELADVFERVAYKYLSHAEKDGSVLATSGTNAIIAAATATDKMRLLRGLPTEIISIVPQLVDALKNAGLDPVQAFNDMIAELMNADRENINSEGESQPVRKNNKR